jgi:uncharacterized membrane protein
MLVYLTEFFIFALLGWIVDSFYSSIRNKKIIVSGYFRGVPLCPIYGFGGIIIINSFLYFSAQHGWITILVTTFFIVGLEYIGGWLALQFLNEKLWDYSKERFNIGGYISAWHSFLWLIAVTMLYWWFDINRIMISFLLNAKLQLDQRLEILLLFAFIIIALWLTIKNKKIRLARLEKERLNIINSVEEMFDMDKWQKLTLEKRDELLKNWSDNKIFQQLRKSLHEHTDK